MNTWVKWGVLAFAVALAVPAAGATWMGYGSMEPNTHYDREGGLMYLDPPTTSSQVYFDVVTGLDATTGSPGVSPNSATLGSRIESPATQADFEAVLGVWVDCNHDNYIGMADAALREYPASLSAAAGHPIDLTLCPDLPDVPANAGKIHYSAASGWVTEMIPIGVSTSSDGSRHAIGTDDRTISDLSAKVWGDHLEPYTHNIGMGSVTCTTLFANGASRHTGGMLQHTDCLDGHAADGTHDTAAGAVPLLGLLPEPSTTYADGSPADKPIPLMGDDNSNNAFVSGAQDCSKPPIVDLTSQLNNGGNPGTGQRGVRAPAPHTNPNGNIPGQLNETHEELFVTDDCTTSDDYGHDYYGIVESPGSDYVTNHVLKTTADMNFQFRPWNARWGCAGASGKAVCGAPQDFGLPEAYNWQDTGGNLWSATSPSSLSVGSTVDRSSLTVTPNLFPANWYTFFAFVTPTSLTTVPGSGTYGSEFCTVGGANVNGWDCNPADWNLIAGTSTPVGNKPWLGNVGDPYNLRDVDCYDTTLVAGASSANPTHKDVGAHSVAALRQNGPHSVCN